MLRKLIVISLVLTVGWPLAAADDNPKGDQPKATLEPLSLHVRRRPDEKRFGRYKMQSDEWTSVEFLVILPGKQMIRIDDSSKPTVFADDTGQSFIDPKGTQFRPYPRMSPDREAMVVVVSNSALAPTKGATKVFVKGDLVLACGTDETTTPEVEVDFSKPGGKTRIGELELEVDKDGPRPEGIYFHVSGGLRDIKSLTAVTADGKSAEPSTQGSREDGGARRRHSYRLVKPAASAKVRVTYFAGEEKVTIPVDLVFTPGL